MAIHYSTDNLPELQHSVITIGTFDGVHMGHRAILKEVADHARKTGGESVLLTFEPHPRKLIFPDKPLHILTPLNKKVTLISAEGIEHIVVVPFTKEFAALSAREYVSEFLVKKFKPRCIVIGYDHHFGHDRKGNIELLKELSSEYDYEVVEISAQLIDHAAVSSTKIRHALEEGHVSHANEMLGRHYTLTGTVLQGEQLGRTIGYPTANIQPSDPDQLIPENGVYAVRVTYKNKSYGAMLNIGYRPTVSNEHKLNIEAHIFDFSGEIYGDELEIEFIQRTRDEQKFNSVDELKQQLAKDKITALEILSV